jgi:NAD(P)-dependent dehydrogenase (short-subunit alcohol dehydrogenase family)
MTGRLEGRKAVITGGASGIGRAASELFAQEGAKVLAVDLAGSDLTFKADAVRGFEADVAAADAPARIMAAAASELGGLDILFNNAGVSDRGALTEIDDAFWDRTLDINLRAGFRLIQAAVPLLTASSCGRIISTASVAAIRSGPGLGAYSASKAGLVGLTRSFAYELGVHGVTANCILPGATLTKMTQRTLGVAAYAEEQASRTALKRIGAPIDIARVALFLASDDSAYVTGQSIAVDGGMSIRA